MRSIRVAASIVAAFLAGATLDHAIEQHVVWIRNGESIGETMLSAARVVSLDTVARPGDWFSVIVRQADDDPTVFANAIYVGR